MKSAVIFLALFMVFMMAEPGECFWHNLLKGGTIGLFDCCFFVCFLGIWHNEITGKLSTLYYKVYNRMLLTVD